LFSVFFFSVMPLRREFKAQPLIELGVTAPPLAEQCATQGLVLRNPDLWEERHKAWMLLRLGGFLTDAEATRIGDRLIDQMGLAVGLDTVIADLGVEITEPKASNAETEGDDAPDSADVPPKMVSVSTPWSVDILSEYVKSQS
jgi:hypothetical protein